MEKELFLTGYCRCIDGSRVVEVILTDDQLTEVDCLFENCCHRADCEIGKQLLEMQK